MAPKKKEPKNENIPVEENALQGQEVSVGSSVTKNFPTWYAWQANYFHIFPEDTREIPKDVDNYSYKRTNDIIAYALGSCDNALRFSMSMTTVFTDKIVPGTYIEIVPKSSENIDFLIDTFGVET